MFLLRRPRGNALMITLIALAVLLMLVASAIQFTGTNQEAAIAKSRADETRACISGLAARLAESVPRAGTPYYMPPEAFRGEKSEAGDVYGLAASLFWLLTGNVPFPAMTEEELLARIRQGLPVEAPCGPGTPEAVEELIRAGLAAEVARRPSLREFLGGLRGALNRLLADTR